MCLYIINQDIVLIFAVENSVKFCHLIQKVSLKCTAGLFSNIDFESLIHSDTTQRNRNKAWWWSKIYYKS